MQGRLVAGRYRLGESIGSGGMGRVWRAHDEVLHRVVAIKELTAAHYVSESDQAILLARTRGEARAAARINHSAVVTVHDVLEHDGRPWIVMELVEGRSLADAVKEDERVAPREAARIGLWVLRALRAAHTAGVLHRDVKPGNVLLADDGRVLLTDFGIAQIEGDSTITRTGEVVGSVDYLAPERVRGHDPGPASDLWALGATLYTAVEGRSPFRRTSPLTTMQAVVEEDASEPLHAGPLAPVISALLRKDPADRPGATEAEHLLAEAAEGRRPHAAQAYVPTQYAGAGQAPAPVYPGHPGTAAQTPYPPVTGPTAVGHQPAGAVPGAMTGGGTAPMGYPPAAPARPRRRVWMIALVVAFAALVGVGTAVLLQASDKSGKEEGADRGGAVTGSPTPSASGSPSGDDKPAVSVPADWVRHDDPLGFSLSLPPGWEREELTTDGSFQQVDYTPDGGKHFVRIAIDGSPDFADAKSHQKDLEQQLQKLVGYERVTMKENTYRDCKGALWEYTWTALAKDPPYVAGPRHAIEEMYFARDGVEYAIYMSSPEEDWATTSEQFTWVLRSWQEKTA
ncbi:serine/threonine-protein kinase [Streptomyces sp. SID5910]|uniref:serine/threonine-protein kinase n=1 Tax=Streptomyces sp. SID5910 TaxID=2690312 RepID=UPI0013718CAF|nr:serine/threonine-protein kinase [Streptomyces sp. SID5910]MYR41868.1 protein kinase [Streptomyces sp. SID5910]